VKNNLVPLSSGIEDNR